MKKIYVILLLVFFGLTPVLAQNSQTLYFMEEIAERNNMNPAFTPNCKFYFDFVLLPNFYLGAGTDQFVLNDIIFNKDGSTTTFLSSAEETQRFLGKLKPAVTLNANFNLNILSFGFQVKKRHYITFDFGLNLDAAVYVPRDVFKLALLGTPDADGVNTFNFNKLGVDATLYSNVSVGYMNKINKQWTVGVKAKYLMGYANISTDIDRMRLDASKDNWTLATSGRINASAPITFGTDENGNLDPSTLGLQKDAELLSLLYRPAGHGAAIDLGVTYKPIKDLTISAAITDLGFIHWNRNLVGGQMDGEHTIDGFIDFAPGDTINGNVILDRLEQVGSDILNSMSAGEAKPYTSMLYANFTVGAEYGVLNNKISFGVVNRLRFNNSHVRDEVTLAANFRPLDWLKASVSYSFVNGRGGNIGLGLNLRAGMFNTYLILDYLPVSYAMLNHSSLPSVIPAPNRTQMFNIQAGLSWNLRRFSNDRDDDGVFKYKDKCPDTDMDFLRKQCPGLKKKQLVDRKGCDLDADNDGIHDCYDRCPNTPAGVVVDSVGCPVDTDHDGVVDYQDQCPDTPEGVEVDSQGCPLDGDGDGVPDYLDHCQGTPERVEVDSVGCPVDTDHDGVADYMDDCRNTPAGVEVDEKGCPVDTDGDGVPDYLDRCPETAKGLRVDSVGCPIDSDGDGVTDDLDKCPFQRGTVANHGCPELTREVTNLLKKAMTGIQFESGRDVIKKSSYSILDKIVAVLEFNPEYRLNISGHTDNTGNAERNMQLSKERAAAVAAYFVKKGIDPSRLHSEGYGQTKPIADNKTSKGRATNRRVEFEVVYEEVTQERVVNPELMESQE